MKTYTQTDLAEYNQNDWILKMLKENTVQEEVEIRTNKWLREMDNKRMIFADVYGDILLNKKEVRVLDIGGGIHHLRKCLLKIVNIRY
mgnify:CR=1 FL=1